MIESFLGYLHVRWRPCLHILTKDTREKDINLWKHSLALREHLARQLISQIDLGLCFWRTDSLANGNSLCGLASQYLRRESDVFKNRFRDVCLVRYCFRQCPSRGRQGGSLK
jgi:hypothetical protein